MKEGKTAASTAYSFCDICSPMPNCGVTCTIQDGKILHIEGTENHPGGGGVLCTKGLALRQYLNREDRLNTPLRRVGERGSGRFEPISWEEAFREITQQLQNVKKQYGASSVAFYSGYNKWYRPFLQRLAYSFGSVNYGSESSTCFSATAMSWKTAVGHDSMRPDRKNCGTFLGWGYNPYCSGNASGISKGKEKVIVVDPRITPAVSLEADLHLRLRPGTDGALAAAIARELIIHDRIDHDFVENHVYGYEQYKEYVMRFTPKEGERITGVPKEKIIEAAKIIGENRPLCINQSASAFVHHKNGYQNHRAVYALIALTGSYDVPGGMIPNPDTLAHTMVGFASRIHEFEWEKYPKETKSIKDPDVSANRPASVPLPVGAGKYPVWHALVGEMQACDLARQIKEKTPYPVKAIVAHGMNYRMFNADTELEEALRELDFFVDADLFMTDSAKLADIVLPVCSSFERSELKLYGGGYAQYYEPVTASYGSGRSFTSAPAEERQIPVGSSRMADDEIIFELARRLDVDDDLLKEGRDACYRSILPGIDLEALKADPAHPHKLEIKVFKDGRGDPETCYRTPVGSNRIQTPTGKFELWSTVLEKIGEKENDISIDPLPVYKESLDDSDPAEYPLQLVSGGRLPYALHSRLHDVPWLRSLRPEPMADLHPEDAAERAVSQGDVIDIRTAAGSISVKANLTAAVLKGTVFMYHGYREADVNSIIPPGHNDPYSGFPGFRSVRCEVRPDGSFAQPDSLRNLFMTENDSGRISRMPRCTGCGACAVACMELHDIRCGQKPFRRIGKIETGEEISYASHACRHCKDPACLKICPKNCFYKDEETGLVLYNNEKCIGCGACAAACPFDAVSFRKTDEGQIMEKCDGCIERIRAGEKAFCAKNCPTGAL